MSLVFSSLRSFTDRFSVHPDIALPHLQPHTYGQVFYNQAMSLVGLNLGVPSRETILAFALLSLAAFGHGSDLQVRMSSGIAVRLCMEMGLHLVGVYFVGQVIC